MSGFSAPARQGWQDVDTTYDFAVDGAVVSIESSNLGDGYKHRFFFEGLEIASADQVDFEVYRETDGAWLNAGRAVGSVATADFVCGYIVFPDARVADNYHSVELLADDENNGMTGNSYKAISLTTNELIRFETAQPIQKVRFFTPAVVNFTGGKIIHQRKAL